MRYVLGVDIGTSGTKTVLFNELGEAIASATVEYPMYQPQNGYAEQDPEDWYNATVSTIKTVVEKSSVNNSEIIGIGLSGQMHGLVMLDENNEIIRKSIIWCDQRTAKEVDEMNEKVGREKLIEITANPALTGWTAAKILWVKNNEPENYAKCRHILLPKDYIRFKLTGEFATEVSDASGMQLLDVPNRCWSNEICELLDIDVKLLPEVYESYEVSGRVTSEAALLTSLKEGTAVVGGAGDNAAAAVGMGVVSDGKAFTTIGTSGVVFAHTSKISIDPKGRVHTCCAAVPDSWHIMGVVQSAGLSLKWFRDNFCQETVSEALRQNVDPYYLMDKEAELIPIGADNLLYLPYLMGERTPHLDPNARGVFFGLSAIHTKQNMLRAVMEGVMFALRDSIEICKELNIDVSDMMACGGGGRSSLWRQMMADQYGCPVKTSESKEGPALGVAILALVGTGVYGSVQEACEKIVKAEKIQNPIPENSTEYEKYYALYKELYPVLKASFAKLSEI
ncbi:MAG: xylulokinase [Ruminococcus sp.]|nr:xylulokinase [Ruminococcus sp.]